MPVGMTSPELTTEEFLLLWANFGLPLVSIVLIALLALLFSSYVKIVTVLGILRAGLGAGSVPAIVVTSGLALALSFFVMFPTLKGVTKAMHAEARQGASQAEVLAAGVSRWKVFLEKHADEATTDAFAKLAAKSDGDAPEQHVGSWRVLAPAFVVSELKRAFATGLSIFLPFLAIDLIVANVLVAIGLVHFSPLIASLPLKLLLFVVVDGWGLITTNLVETYV
ncbi:MAG: EscR/YscR/HrcR family type III secretion system export apparatus protein [Bdellovibrionales bacterium]|nr:EscR/YscR/HrcR family type III secretion system export apparatus protein [Bdellovibrionales bacterium]